MKPLIRIPGAPPTTTDPKPKRDLRMILMNHPRIPRPTVEYIFARPRMWRFDFAWPDRMVAVEYEGIYGGGKSRHTAGGFVGDCEKYSMAAILGWCVVRVTADMVKAGKAIALIEMAHGSRG